MASGEICKINWLRKDIGYACMFHMERNGIHISCAVLLSDQQTCCFFFQRLISGRYMPATYPSKPDHLFGEGGRESGYFKSLSGYPNDNGFHLTKFTSNTRYD